MMINIFGGQVLLGTKSGILYIAGNKDGKKISLGTGVGSTA